MRKIRLGTRFMMKLLLLLACTCLFRGIVFAEELDPHEDAAPSPDHTGYHTPLAGEPRKMVFMGEEVDIPAVDRKRVTSLTLGGSAYFPRQGNTIGLPVAALYLKRVNDTWRTRDVISIFENDLEYDKPIGKMELVAHFENRTIPRGQTVVVNNQEIKPTSVAWGYLLGGLGPGIRCPLSSGQIDNDWRVQLLGRVGYFYAKRTRDTAPDLVLPPDTMLYGVKLRTRYDGMRRNMLELPHQGFALGADLDYLHRDRWQPLPTEGAPGSRRDTRDYVQMSGYLMVAGGLPGLSEKNRGIFTLYGGRTNSNSADRFNTFRINGGPFPSEVDDVWRPHYEGIVFDDAPVDDYVIASLAYRRELTFFLYLTLGASYIQADRATVLDTDDVVFRSRRGVASTIGIDSAFLWDSSLYLAYAWDSGFMRNGRSGSGVILTWNKSF